MLYRPNPLLQLLKGRDVSSFSMERLEYSVEGKDYVEVIDHNFQWSSSLLLDLLMKEMDLMTRLR